MSETSCVNATGWRCRQSTSNKGKGAEVGKQVVELLQEAGRKHGFNVIDVTGESFDDSLANARIRQERIRLPGGGRRRRHDCAWSQCRGLFR